MNATNHKNTSRYVDMWAIPSIHPSNFELFQELKSADTRHFTHNMDSVGTVSERNESGGWEETHLVGLRTDIWKPDEVTLSRKVQKMQKKRKAELRQEIKRSGRLTKEQKEKLEAKLADDAVMQTRSSEIVNQRLVLKLFKTSTKRLQWCGTIEEVTTTEIHNSLGTKKPLISMSVMLPGTKIVTEVQQNHRTFRIPSTFSLCHFHNDQPFPFVLKRRWFSFGADFDVIYQDKTVGKIDSKLLCLGSNSYVNLENHELADSTPFQDLLTLFAASIGYHKAMRKNIKQRIRANLSGEEHLNVTDNDEIQLQFNGRRAA